jgi:hypothetical protein
VKSEAFLVDTSNKKINFIETVWLIHANILCLQKHFGFILALSFVGCGVFVDNN